MGSFSPSIDVLIGGGITIAVAVSAMVAEQRWARRQRMIERNAQRSASAFSAQVKIAQGHAWTRSVKRSIDECFAETSSSGADELDPGVRVTPLVGVDAPATSFSPEELSLALQSGDAGLLEELLSFQWNCRTHAQLLSEFNSARREYSEFVRDNAHDGEFVDGAYANVSMPAEKKHAMDARIADLNLVISCLIEGLEEQLRRSKEIMKRFQTAMNSVEGVEIHGVTFLD